MPESPATAGRPARRTVLRLGVGGVAGAAVLTTAGCDLRFGSPSPSRPRGTAPDLSTDEQALGAALQRADGLATAYARAIVVRPDLADPLRQLAADHDAHVRVLRPLAGPAATIAPSTPTSSPSSSPSSSLTSSAPTSPGPTPTPGAAGPAATPLTSLTAVSVLAQSERAAAGANLAELASVSGPAARLLASVAGCNTAHVALLAALPAPKAATGASTPSTTAVS